ncbi:MAG: hypothetical protein K8R90_08975 [Candidatus Cloacimonetes bacterium]|nr:hypothetical protein [Candidatus Cloacimonadota bacterium]
MKFFFKINLNKYGELKQQAEAEARTFRNTVISFVVLFLILYGGVFYLRYTMQKKVDFRRDVLADINSQIEKYQTSGDYLSAEDLQKIAEISRNRIFWAKKLVAFSEQTDDKIAIEKFTYKNGVLKLFGITPLDREQQELDLIIEGFINDLQNNEQIAIDFPEIYFEKSRKDKEKDTDIVKFEIACVAREED